MTIQRPPAQQPPSALENPMDLPLAFKSWLVKYLEVNPPTLPISQMLGYQDPAVSANATEIQSEPVDPTAPTTNQALVWNGTHWIPETMTASQITNAADLSDTGLQSFAGPIEPTFSSLGPSSTGALASHAITVASGSFRINSTDGTSLTKINGHPSNSGWLLQIVNNSGSDIPYATGGGSGIGIGNSGTIPNGSDLTLWFDPVSVVWVPVANRGSALVTHPADLDSATLQNFSATIAANNFEGNQVTVVQSATSYTPIVTTDHTFTLQLQPVLSGVTFTVANPGGIPAATQDVEMVVHIQNQTGAVFNTLAWGSAYKFGGWASNPSIGTGLSYSWVFKLAGNTRLICVGTSNGTWS